MTENGKIIECMEREYLLIERGINGKVKFLANKIFQNIPKLLQLSPRRIRRGNLPVKNAKASKNREGPEKEGG